MNDINADPSPASSELIELKSACADLQAQTHTLRIILLFVMGSLCLFFWREASFNGRIALQMQPQVMQAAQFIDTLNKQGTSIEKQLQALQGAVSRLVDYGRTHPDYVPILNKYGVPVTPAAAAPAAPPKK
jgi:hypothetical protein